MEPEDAAARRVRSCVVAGIPVLPQRPPHVPRVLGVVLAQDGLDCLRGLLINPNTIPQYSHLGTSGCQVPVKRFSSLSRHPRIRESHTQ